MLYIEVSPDKISPDTYPGLRAWIDELNTFRERPVKVVMAVEDDNVQGIVVYEDGNIIYIYVPEDVRLSGVATHLLRRAVRDSKQSRITTHVHQSNVNGVCFLLKSGFVIEGWFTGVDNVRYLRMTNTVIAVHTPPQESHLASFAKSVPIFLSMAEGNF